MNFKQLLFATILIGYAGTFTACETLTMKTIINGVPLKYLLYYSPKLYRNNNLYLEVGIAEANTYITWKNPDGSIEFVKNSKKENVKDLYHYIHYNHIHENQIYHNKRTKEYFPKELEAQAKKGSAIYCPNIGFQYYCDSNHEGEMYPVGAILLNSDNPCHDCKELSQFIKNLEYVYQTEHLSNETNI